MENCGRAVLTREARTQAGKRRWSPGSQGKDAAEQREPHNPRDRQGGQLWLLLGNQCDS
ncbi:hypothetical protein LX15_004669 [Streptoalloteichus tenebrarius]|uniref:Transposase n=1 Tax=Streptoalloteichus tenebrarius (strain ATCC 17920 / DSM 40477 / JCM 4838 / CBS 697.72 / NBRC 16177 / NCIMB 11028 / NRRL B-12390 / A12253. 1 / ISP 5477) TaxID=1933 RepID=A0ABT1HZM2_STRSD|nr:hypothetical protein [Streptoalloteichus tenebrarius]